MKKIAIMLFAILLIASCKQEQKTAKETEQQIEEVVKKEYPENIAKVFEAHGGIDNWNKMQTLAFTMNRPNGAEVTTNNLKTRTELIDAPTYSLGFDGNNLWVNEKDTVPYRGNAKFYKGLMFYFYAMPFIVADDGIIYEDAEPLEFEGKTYPGVLISYNAGVGASPEDQYIVYYDPETYQMEWLGYTVTFRSQEKSTNFNFNRYNNWETINGLILPKSIDRYASENNVPTEMRGTIEFVDGKVSEEAPDASLFTMPEDATAIE